MNCKLPTFLIALTLTFVLAPKVLAQNISLGIIPPTFQIVIQPGKSLTQVYKIINNGDPVIMSSEIVPFVPSSELGDISLIDCQKIEVIGCESVSWFTFQNADLNINQSFFLNSKKTQEIVLKIAVPDYASEGDYYNTLLFNTQAPPNIGSVQSRAAASIGSNILITVSKDGNPSRSLKITQLASEKTYTLPKFLTNLIPPLSKISLQLNIFDTFDYVPVTLKVANTGTAYTKGKGTIKLNGFPGITGIFSIPDQTILAQKTRLLIATPSAKLPAGKTGLKNNITGNTNTLIFPKAFYIGKYTVVVELVNETDEKASKTIAFYAFPLKISAFTILTLIIISISLKIYPILKKRRVKRK